MTPPTRIPALFLVAIFAAATSFAAKKPADTTLAGYARAQKEIVVYTITDKALPPVPRSDQVNNMLPGQKVLTLSGKGLTDINGISGLQVVDGGKTMPLSEVQNLHLFLNDNAIGELPRELFSMRNIIFIYLENNKLDEIPAQIAKMKNLLGMYYTNNNIRSIPPEVFTMKQLKKFQVSKNHLTEIPDAIGNLTEIRHFNFSSNKITKVPAGMSRLTKLRVCDLSDNLITELPEAFGTVRIFHQLRVIGNPLTSLPAGFANMPGTIDITGTKIDVSKLPDGLRARISTEKHASKSKPHPAKQEDAKDGAKKKEKNKAKADE